ncbi:hypothetical protein T492DRAFT_1017006 [Pavlovales sp. CCMP2436]|nr:hypothetical protein T492DRAFT_1017006 [Pavlovales sp. CCMP2436]
MQRAASRSPLVRSARAARPARIAGRARRHPGRAQTPRPRMTRRRSHSASEGTRGCGCRGDAHGGFGGESTLEGTRGCGCRGDAHGGFGGESTLAATPDSCKSPRIHPPFHQRSGRGRRQSAVGSCEAARTISRRNLPRPR